MDCHIRKADRGTEPVGRFRVVFVVCADLQTLPSSAVEEVPDGFDGHAARDFPRGVSPHSVGNEEQPRLFHDKKVVLVVLPRPADVRLRTDEQLHLRPPGIVAVR